MPKLIMNAAFNVQFEGDYNKNGTPKVIAKPANPADPKRLGVNIDTTREMVDAWNEKYGTKDQSK